MKKALLHGERVFFFLIIAFFLFPMTGHAADESSKFPTRTITYIQPYAAGSSADLAMRLISKEAEKFLGQPVIVVNKPGASGTIGVAAIASATPDGYTVGNTPHSPMFINPHLEKLPYNPVRDFRMIMQYAAFNMGLFVKSDSPFKSFKDVITFARQNPKKLTYGGGKNSMQNILMEQIAKKEQVQFTFIPFTGATDTQTALLGGHILLGTGDFNYSLVESGEVRLLLLLREERAAEYPEIPIVKDMGYDFPFPTFICVVGPKGLPDGIAKKLEDAFTKAMKEPAFIKGMKEDIKLPIVYRNSKDLTAYVAQNYENYGRVLKDMGLIK